MPCVVLAVNHAKMIHPICTEAKPYVPYFPWKHFLNLKLVALHCEPSIGWLSFPSFKRSSGCHHISLAFFLFEIIASGNYREMPHNLRGQSFAPITFHRLSKVTLVASVKAHWTHIQIFIIVVIQYAIIDAHMTFWYFEPYSEDHLLRLVHVLKQLIWAWKSLPQKV